MEWSLNRINIKQKIYSIKNGWYVTFRLT